MLSLLFSVYIVRGYASPARGDAGFSSAPRGVNMPGQDNYRWLTVILTARDLLTILIAMGRLPFFFVLYFHSGTQYGTASTRIVIVVDGRYVSTQNRLFDEQFHVCLVSRLGLFGKILLYDPIL